MAAPTDADDGSDDALIEDAQRRRSFRVDLLETAELRMPGRTLQTVQVVDLSGTGFGFHTRDAMTVDTTGHVTLPFGIPRLDLPFVVRVVRTDGHRRYVGCEFVDLTAQQEDAVVREVFAEQRRQLRNLRGGAGA